MWRGRTYEYAEEQTWTTMEGVRRVDEVKRSEVEGTKGVIKLISVDLRKGSRKTENI